MRSNARRALKPSVQRLLDCVPAEVRNDLVHEDPATAIEVHYAPVRVHAMPAASLVGDDCSIDGFYDAAFDLTRPWIFYANDVSPRRARFTLLHELGHHLVVTALPELLDDLDQIGGSAQAALELEETLCHQFAGSLLVPDDILAELSDESVIRPRQVLEIHTRVQVASWEAVSTRVAELLPTAGAIVILRDHGIVNFCSARGLEHGSWRRGSRVQPTGPLSRAFSSDQTAQPDVYRWGLGYERQLFCDTQRIHDGLVVAVLSAKRSDGGLNILDEIEPAWKTRQTWCEYCNEERTDGWCDTCHDRHCPECGRCACDKPRTNPVCPECGLRSPFREGSTMCRTCEQDRGLI